MAEVLKTWYNYNPRIEDSPPERYVEYLMNIQDFLCRLLEDNEYGDIVIEHISSIISIKDDLKIFIPQKERES